MIPLLGSKENYKPIILLLYFLNSVSYLERQMLSPAGQFANLFISIQVLFVRFYAHQCYHTRLQ